MSTPQKKPIIRPVKSRTTLRQYGTQHLQACVAAFGAMSKAPLASLMSLAVIGIALSLPFGLYVILDNIQVFSQGWNGDAQISLYLKPEISLKNAANLIAIIEKRPDVGVVKLISPDDGLKELESYSGFTNILAELETNPLPSVIEIHPAKSIHSTRKIQQLLTDLRAYAEVDVGKLDLEWVQRFYTMINLGRQIVYGLAILLAIGVILIIGNTIRLNTQSHRSEIEVIKLVGGTNAFIRRPFLYSGLLYGGIGAIIALVLIDVFISWLQEPVQQLARLYDSTYHLQGLDNQAILILLFTGAACGFIGSWFAVAKHLRNTNPRA